LYISTSNQRVPFLQKPTHYRSNKWLLPAVLLLLTGIAVSVSATADLESRVVTIRMLLFLSAALYAFITPYAAFPDRNAPLMQMGNVESAELFRVNASHFALLYLGGIWLFLNMIFIDIHAPFELLADKLLLFLSASAFYTGLLLFSLSRFLRIGSDSQQWQEGVKGANVRRILAEVFKYPMDPGTIPSMWNTVLITLIGMTGVLFGAMLAGTFGLFGEAIPALIIFGMGVLVSSRVRSATAGYYYQTNAFFREFFGADLKGQDQIEPLRQNQLWWVPAPIKMHVWAMMLQCERKIPAGRIIVAGHFLIWLLAYQQPAAGVILGAWLLFSLFHQFLLFFTIDESIAPIWWNRYMASPSIWFFVRFWMQLRWLLPLGVSMFLMQWLFAYPDKSDMILIFSSYLVFAGMTAAAFTLKHEKHVNA